jgi:hypothetical protein
MMGVVFFVVAILLFVFSIAVPLFAMRWKTLAVMVGLGGLSFWWLTTDIQAAGTNHWLGSFLGGLMLFGFVAGVVAKFVMLLGGSRPDVPPTDDQSGPAGL